MKKASIKTKLMLTAVLFMIYPIIIIGYFGYRNYSNVMKERAISDSQSTARELSSLLSERMQKLNLFSIQIFYDRKIYDAYNDILSDRMNSFAQNSFEQYLQSILLSKYELNEILVHFNKDNRTFQVNRTLLSETDSFSEMQSLYKSALKGSGKPVWYVAHKDGKVTGIYLAKIIYDLQDIKSETGMLAFKVDEQYLFGVLNNFIAHTKHNVGLYTNDGQPIFVNEAFEVGSQKSIDDSVKEIHTKNDTVYMLYDTIEPSAWRLAIGISSNVLFKEVRNIARLIILLCIATLPICAFFIDYLYISIVRPMNLLIKRMNQIESGDIGVTIENKRDDEFGYVFRTFNKMSQNIKSLIDTVYKKQLAMKDAEIKALQAQINPHFLYNTLEAINWKARMNGVEEISDMVSALSYIIEANLNRNNEKFIPVYKEIEYIESYNFLIQKRFGKRIRFTMNVDDGALNHIIPKLLVQPIVENSIYHGLEMKKGEGIVNIIIKVQDDILIISVADNGLGIEETVLKKLREDLSDEKFLDNEESIKDSSKIGVLNVHRRVKLLYGEGYGLEISSEENKGTTVIIRLPNIISKGSEEIVQGSYN